MQVYGAIVYHGVEFINDELLTVDPKRTLYGIDWVFAGDLDFNECDIYASHKLPDGSTRFVSLIGRGALRQLLAWAAKHTEPA